MNLKPIFQARLIPRDPHSSIKYIDVMVEDTRIQEREICLNFLESQFPMYEVNHLFDGYKQSESNKRDDGHSYDFHRDD